MTNSKKKIFPVPCDINWHEGMLLSQHHFQQNDLRNFRVFASQIQLLSSNHFGVRHLKTDTVALSGGIYRIREIEAVFPDGLIFSFFPEKCVGLKSLEIDLNISMKDEDNECIIYLAIAESSDDVSPILGNPTRYYSIEGELVPDDNIKENVVKIPRLFPNGFLCVGRNMPEFCIGFPLCKIIRLDGVFHVKNWTPPCFFIEKHFPLWERCNMLTRSIREKAVYLSEKLRHSSSENMVFGSRKILEQIMMVMPGLEALIYSNEIRPYELYKELSNVLGGVSILIPTDVVPVMQPYDHNDIDGCLYQVITLIEHYILSIERGFSVSSFNRKNKFFYRYLSIEDIEKSTSGKFYIGIKTEAASNVSDIVHWVDSAVMASDSTLEKIRIKRVKGAKRNILPEELVSQILPGIGVTLFEVEIDDDFIKGEQNFHIFNPGSDVKVQPSEVILYLPKEKGKK
ncbi:MAG: type VI secretion system baseplate subunit TssK [Holosporales bacterium]|jgi:type VI secretion system protein ImpJ|nr:type VI secretion system baseplate subunit TssK [Holosporales bacterium]